MKSLRGEALVIWSKEITVAETTKVSDIVKGEVIKTKHLNMWGEVETNYKHQVSDKVIITHREGTKEEKQFILEVERNELKKMDCNNKGEIVAKGLWEDFKDSVGRMLLKEKNIAYYYESYKVVFNPHHILPAIELNKVYELQRFEKEEKQDLINQQVQDRLYKNMIARHDKEQKKIKTTNRLIGRPRPLEDVTKRRSSDVYIENNMLLNNTLIDKEATNITSKVLNIKLIKSSTSSK